MTMNSTKRVTCLKLTACAAGCQSRYPLAFTVPFCLWHQLILLVGLEIYGNIPISNLKAGGLMRHCTSGAQGRMFMEGIAS